LIGRADPVNPLPGGAGFLQGFDGGNGFARILRVNKQLLRHGMFQGGDEETGNCFFLMRSPSLTPAIVNSGMSKKVLISAVEI